MADKKPGEMTAVSKIAQARAASADLQAVRSNGSRRHVQLAYVIADSEASAKAAITAPAAAVGKAIGVLVVPLGNESSATSGAPKIPPGKYEAPPPVSGDPAMAAEWIGSIEVPKSQYVIDVLVQVRKR